MRVTNYSNEYIARRGVMPMRHLRAYFNVLFLLCLVISGSWTVAAKTTNYSDAASWAYWNEGQRVADCFLICPEVYITGTKPGNLSLTNKTAQAAFVGALNMERGIYADSCTLYAPFYQQASLEVYQLSEAERVPYLEKAYRDIKKAFKYYLRHSEGQKPLVLAGFSQGQTWRYDF